MRVPIVSDLADAIMGKPKVQPEDMYLPANLPEIDFSQYNTPEFHEEQNRRAELNIKVDSKEAMKQYVKESSLSLRCKNAWLGIIETYYDRNILLSDLTGKKVNQGRISTDEKVQIAYWRAKIDVMGSVRCNSRPYHIPSRCIFSSIASRTKLYIFIFRDSRTFISLSKSSVLRYVATCIEYD